MSATDLDSDHHRRAGLERFLLVRRYQSVTRSSARHDRVGDFSSMSLTPPLRPGHSAVRFRFDHGANERTRAINRKFSEISIFGSVRKE
jgi:hypothetical protein